VKVSLIVTGSLAVTVLVGTVVATLAGALETVIERASTTVPVDGGNSQRADTQSTEYSWGLPTGRASGVLVSSTGPSCDTDARTRERNDGWAMSPD
jgi:hypothetical protein